METVLVETTVLVEQKPLTTQFYLLLVSGITGIVEQKFRKSCFFTVNFDADLSKVGMFKLIKLKEVKLKFCNYQPRGYVMVQ